MKTLDTFKLEYEALDERYLDYLRKWAKSLCLVICFGVIFLPHKIHALPFIEEVALLGVEKAEIVEVPKTPEPVKYIVVKGDSLTKIAESQNTTPQRLFDKNLSISNPDSIKPGDELIVPSGEEVLAGRESPVVQVATPVDRQSLARSGEAFLTGSIGYAKAGGNCVNEPGVNSPHNGTNPISWAVLSKTPTVGATVLFRYNHTGVVTGIWSDGSLEIRHQNYNGKQHRFPASTFRGYR